jgi:PAS domain S-box-containing protein
MLGQSQATAQVGSWEVTLDEGAWEVPGTALWSSETYRILGYELGTPASLARYYGRIHPEDRAALQAQSALAVDRGEPIETEYRIVRPDGSVRVIHAWLHFEREADGKTTRAFGTCQDITERKLADLTIRRAREQLQLVVDTTPALIARYDRDRRLVWGNKSYAARFGKRPEELVGTPLADLVGEVAFRVIEPLCARVLQGESVEVEVEIPYADCPRFVHMSATPTLDAAGAPDGCVTVLTDRTRRRELEQERERALAELREADRRKDEFLAMLSHELRNPLAAILNAAEILGHLGAGRADGATLHTVISRQARHMKRLLDDLLDVSRVSQGKIELQWERADLNGLLEQALEISRPILAEKRHVVSVALAARPMAVFADSTRLVQVFANLVNNAAKYTDPGGHIDVTSAVENDEAVVTVRDDGVGMTPDMLARAFDLFVQEERSLDRAQGGLGIGLTLVRTLVKMHGGSVHAASDGPGRGSKLVVRLPLAAPAAPSPAPPATTSQGEVATAPLRVLLVDDDLDAADALGMLLHFVGHEVTVVHNGQAALAAAAAAPPDVVLLDIGLPGMDGYAVAARLREAGHARAALVAVTGYGRADDVQRSRDAGFDHHVVKPVDSSHLEKILLEISARRR